MSRQRRTTAAPEPEQRQAEGAAELGELLRKAPKAEEPRLRVGALVRITNIEPHRPVYRWLTNRHVFRVQLIDRLGPKPILVLIETDSRDSVAAPADDCEVVG